MRVFLQKFIFSILLFFVSGSLWSQPSFQSNTFKSDKFYFNLSKDSVDTEPMDTNFTLSKKGFNPTIPAALGVAGFFYLFNPIVLLEDDKIALGVTKEVSLGFGEFGENRLSFEYSYIFRESGSSQFRLGFKRDLIMSDILPSHQLQATTALAVGASSFYDLEGWGVSPEVAFGFSLRNDKLLIFPHVKGRYTYTFNSQKSNIIDFSFGLMIGFANPFNDLKIRRHW
ncbi:MAG: hypothetical protein JST55_10430 [Bacteroidetes bacterium]|nr:hypothetical protein [Bacteroidota bacterium]